MEIMELLKQADAPIQWLVIILIFVRLDMRLGQLLEWQNQQMIKLFDMHATIRTGKSKATRQHDNIQARDTDRDLSQGQNSDFAP